MLKVLTVTIDVLPNVVPLVAGYLQAYASLDPAIRERYEFHTYSCATTVAYEDLLRDLEQQDADVYAFSCYCWNTRLVRRVTAALLEAKPGVNVILGGPQVMNQGHSYLDPDHPSMVLCNGEGEKTFRSYLLELLAPRPSFASVRGMSFYYGDKLVTTLPEERIKDLDEIPSPFLAGCFPDDAQYTMCFLETNRGCPFKCSYCYWGGAIGARVNKMGADRVRDDITWISKRGIPALFLVDANWGMLKRDVELTEHLIASRNEHGFPMEVYFQSAKNSPEQVGEISRMLAGAGLLGAASIAIQSMSDVALERVGRSNIKKSTYRSHQETLARYDINSFIELLWPLPGETLASFRDGISELCESGADSFMIYPLLLINNCELNEQRESFGLLVDDSEPGNGAGEERLIVGTNEVPRSDYEDGWGVAFATVVLHNLRGLSCVAAHLHRQGIRKYGDLFGDFAAFIQSPAAPCHAASLGRFLNDVFQPLRYDMTEAYGRAIHHVCHEARAEFDACLAEFVTSQPWWNEPLVKALFEADLLNRVYVYAGDIREPFGHSFRYLELQSVDPEGYLVSVPGFVEPALRQALGQRMAFSGGAARIRHRQKQIPLDVLPFGSSWHWNYCTFRMLTTRHLTAAWEDIGPSAVGALPVAATAQAASSPV